MDPEIPSDENVISSDPQFTTDSGVWPPPVAFSDETQGPTFQFTKAAYLRIPNKARKSHNIRKINVSDMRSGTVRFAPGVLNIDGLAAPRAEIQTPILVLGFLICLYVTIISYFVMEYGFRRPRVIVVPWSDVRLSFLDRRRLVAAIAYDAANASGRISTQSLALKLAPHDFDAFEAAATTCLPGRVLEGRLEPGTSIVTYVFAALLVVLVSLAVVLSITLGHQ